MALYWYGWGDRRNPAVYGNFEIIVGPIRMWFSALNPPAPPLPHNRRIARSPYTKTVDTVSLSHGGALSHDAAKAAMCLGSGGPGSGTGLSRRLRADGVMSTSRAECCALRAPPHPSQDVPADDPRRARAACRALRRARASC